MTARRTPRWALVALLGLGTMGLLAAGCAPHLVRMPVLEAGVARARFESALEARRVRGAEAVGEISVWAHRDGVGDPPGVSARLWLEAPEAFRVRVDGLLGTAVEAAGRGDSLVVHAPVWKLGAVSAEVSDPGGFGTAGGVVWTLLSGSVRPPDAAWRTAVAGDSATVVSWSLNADSIALAIGGDGLPRRVTIRGPAHPEWFARYDAWQAWDRVPWPSRIVIGDAGGHSRATIKVQALTLRPQGATRLVRLRLPERALEVTRREGLDLLERLARGGAPADSAAAGE